jgi:hypothetical protein
MVSAEMLEELQCSFAFITNEEFCKNNQKTHWETTTKAKAHFFRETISFFYALKISTNLLLIHTMNLQIQIIKTPS